MFVSALTGTPISASASRPSFRRSQRCVGPSSSYGRFLRTRGDAGVCVTAAGCSYRRLWLHSLHRWCAFLTVHLPHTPQCSCSPNSTQHIQLQRNSRGERRLLGAHLHATLLFFASSLTELGMLRCAGLESRVSAVREVLSVAICRAYSISAAGEMPPIIALSCMSLSPLHPLIWLCCCCASAGARSSRESVARHRRIYVVSLFNIAINIAVSVKQKESDIYLL